MLISGGAACFAGVGDGAKVSEAIPQSMARNGMQRQGRAAELGSVLERLVVLARRVRSNRAGMAMRGRGSGCLAVGRVTVTERRCRGGRGRQGRRGHQMEVSADATVNKPWKQ